MVIARPGAFAIAAVAGAGATLGMAALQWARDCATPPRRSPSEPVSLDSRVTVLVAAWNEADVIAEHVASVLALRYPRLEYVLCAGGPDGTLERARRLLPENDPRFVLIEQHAGEGKQAALRRAFKQCTGDVVWLTDADCLLDDAALEGIAFPIAAGRSTAATGTARPLDRQLDHPLARYQWYRDVYWHLRDGPWAQGILGRNAAVARDTLLSVGAFEAPAPTGTDYQLSGLLRARDAKIANAHSEVRTRVPTSLRAYVRMWQRWIRNPLVQGRQSGRAGEAEQAFVAAVAGLLVLAGPLWVLLGRWSALAWALLAVRGWSERARQCAVAADALGRREDASFYARLWLYYLADCAAAASALLSLLRSEWRTRW